LFCSSVPSLADSDSGGVPFVRRISQSVEDN
jgi:hypothetical protein